jgi:ABC-type branched-subunit amino acid transport system permease subunit
VFGAAAFLLVEDYLQDITQHWMLFFGPLLVFLVLFARNGIYGLIPERFASMPRFLGGCVAILLGFWIFSILVAAFGVPVTAIGLLVLIVAGRFGGPVLARWRRKDAALSDPPG